MALYTPRLICSSCKHSIFFLMYAVTAPPAAPGSNRPLPRPLPRMNAVAGPSRLEQDHKRRREEDIVPSDRELKRAKGKGREIVPVIDLEKFRI